MTEMFKFSPIEIKELHKSNKENGETLYTIIHGCSAVSLYYYTLHVYLHLCILR